MPSYEESGYTPGIFFDNGLFVYRQCQNCGYFISLKNLEVLENGLEEIRLEGAQCKRCGSLPEHTYDMEPWED